MEWQTSRDVLQLSEPAESRRKVERRERTWKGTGELTGG